MGALNPFALWGSLAALGVAVPIIIHLLYRKHRKQTDWAAMELLRRALVIRSGQVKLEDYLILALRCLALLLIAAALLRPTLSSDAARWLGERRTGMVVAIDASFSMNHGEQSRYERAIDAAEKILGEAREGDPVSVVLMSKRPQVLLRGAAYQKEKIAAALRPLQRATPHGLGLQSNLEQLEELLDDFKTPGKECYIITDSQELDWGTTSPGAKAALERLKAKSKVYVVPVGTDGVENLGIAKLAYASGSLRKSGVARFTAEIHNPGMSATNSGTIELFVDGELKKRQPIGAVKAGKSTTVDFFASFDKPGEVRLKAQLSKDALADDNVRYAVVNISSSINVLCVEGTRPAVDSQTTRAGAYYAVRAFRLKNRSADSPIQVTQIEAADLLPDDFENFDVIVLANVPDVPPETAASLQRFVKKGKGLMIFAGEGVNPEKRNNERFGELLPAKLLEPIAADPDTEEAGWTISGDGSNHPIAQLLDNLSDELLDAARLFKILRAGPTEGSEVILTVAEVDAPLVIERHIGLGSVILVTSSADRSWNELAVHPLYPMLLQQAATNLTSHPHALKLTVGEQTTVPAAYREVGDTVTLTGPASSTTVKLASIDGQAAAPIDPDATGIYQIAATDVAPPVVVAANVDAQESAVRVVDEAALDTQLDPLGVKVASADSGLIKAIKNGRRGRELANFILWLGIGVFVLQSVLAKIFTNRMSKEDTADVATTLQLSHVAAARRAK